MEPSGDDGAGFSLVEWWEECHRVTIWVLAMCEACGNASRVTGEVNLVSLDYVCTDSVQVFVVLAPFLSGRRESLAGACNRVLSAIIRRRSSQSVPAVISERFSVV